MTRIIINVDETYSLTFSDKQGFNCNYISVHNI